MDSPRSLQDQIHSDFSITSGTWVSYRSQITGLYSATGYAASGNSTYQDFADHLVREFNGKIVELNMPTGLLMNPYDAGYRLTGITIS